MQLTKKMLIDWDACSSGILWYEEKKEPDTVEETLKLLLAEEKYDWCNFLLTNTLSENNLIKYAIFASELVLPIYEKEFPNDNGPRKTIQAVKNYLESPTEENRKICEKIAKIAWAAAATAAGITTRAALWAVAQAADTVIVTAANIAENAATDAAWATTWAATWKKIIKYGKSLLIKQQISVSTKTRRAYGKTIRSQT